MNKNSEIADFLRKTDLIIWDEVPMQHKYCFEAADRCLQDINSSTKLFGGIPVVLGGDFAQIAPVVKNAERSQTVDASIIYSYIWSKCQVLKLKKNMRVQDTTSQSALFKEWLSQLSYNPFLRNCRIKIPSYIHRTKHVAELIQTVYPEETLAAAVLNPALFATSAILTSTNSCVDEINSTILDKIPGTVTTLHSIDSCDMTDQEDSLEPDEAFKPTLEYLSTVNPPNFPPSKLNLKVGVVVMLLRNLNVKEGLCNGTPLVVKHIGRFSLKVAILNPTNPTDQSQVHHIPRIILATLEGELPFILKQNNSLCVSALL